MTDNIDNLLDDLDALITDSPLPSTNDVNRNSNWCSDSSLPYKYPHRPRSEKSPTQLNNPNPKNKFAISPSQQNASLSHQQNETYRSNSAQSQATTFSGKREKNDESIDSLLELLDSPVKENNAHSSSFHSHSSGARDSATVSQYSSSCLSSTPHSANKGSSSTLPSFERSQDTTSSLYSAKRGPNILGNSSSNSSQLSDNSFDSLLSDINSSLPPVSPNGSSNSTKDQTKSQATTHSSLPLQPPPQNTASVKGGRCSRVVLAGSGVARGVKTSAFSKSACDRLRCLKCNFEAIQFMGSAWTETVDYMFFRNNTPNKEKLSVQLVANPSSVAYCCQCSWISTEVEHTLSPGQTDKPQWVCAGH